MAEEKITRRRTAKDKPAEEVKVEAPKVEEPPAEKPKAQNTMVEVRNLRHLDYVQPSTQIRIRGGEKALLLDDAWLMLQCDAKLLERV